MVKDPKKRDRARERNKKEREEKRRRVLEERRRALEKRQRVVQKEKETKEPAKEKIVLFNESDIDKLGENITQEIKKRVSIPFLQRSLDRASKALTTKLKDLEVEVEDQDLRITGLGKLKIGLGSLNTFIQQIKELAEEQPWVDEINEAVKKDDLSGVVSAIREASQVARQAQEYDQAIGMLEKTNIELLQAEKEEEPYQKLKLKLDVLKDLQTNLQKKGKLDKAIKNLDTQLDIYKQLDDHKEYLKVQTEKGFLFIRKGEFSQAETVFRNALDYAENLPVDDKKTAVPELKRSIAVLHRMRGEYDKALSWFSEALSEFQAIQDEVYIVKTLLGIAKVHTLRGEWNSAIKNYEKIIAGYRDKKPDLWFLMTYSELATTLTSSGHYSRAREMANKAKNLLEHIEVKDSEHPDKLHLEIQWLFINIYKNENKLEEALNEVQKAWTLFESSEEKDVDSELALLKLESEILLELNRCNEVREKLQSIFPNIKTDWMKATYWQLSGILEHREMNLGSAKNAFEQAIAKSREIGHYQLQLQSQMMYATLLIDQAKLGDQQAFQAADEYLRDIEVEINTKKIVPQILDCQILRASLASLRKDYNIAYKALSEVEMIAREHNLYRQRVRAQDLMNLIEQEQDQLKSGARNLDTLSVFRYLEDARRIVDEHGS
ncbi:MAG: tetratricopeptide repeat protein [Candidatus Hermodarchaeota archaeon]